VRQRTDDGASPWQAPLASVELAGFGGKTMDLAGLAAGAEPVAYTSLGMDKPLAREIQDRLSALGLLDPPGDGLFGPVSHWALAEFRKAAMLAESGAVDRALARALLDADPRTFLPLMPGNDLAGRIAAAMVRKAYWICRHPDAVNIVYVEGVNVDGTPNGNPPNRFNDIRALLQVAPGGRPVLIEVWDGTTEPGRFFTEIDPHPEGAARIAFGQFKSWGVGTHKAGTPSAHEALVQREDVTVHRDLDRNFSRLGDRTFTGMFGINQHWGFDMAVDNIGKASAGCLVGRTKAGHRAFMKLVKADPRHAVSHGYRLMTTILAAEEL
jgi:hypothetical protein